MAGDTRWVHSTCKPGHPHGMAVLAPGVLLHAVSWPHNICWWLDGMLRAVACTLWWCASKATGFCPSRTCMHDCALTGTVHHLTHSLLSHVMQVLRWIQRLQQRAGRSHGSSWQGYAELVWLASVGGRCTIRRSSEAEMPCALGSLHRELQPLQLGTAPACVASGRGATMHRLCQSACMK